MEERPFFGITSVSKETLEAVVRQNGRVPDNFVDSSEVSFLIPDMMDPAPRRLLEAVDKAVDGLVKRSRTGADGPTPLN